MNELNNAYTSRFINGLNLYVFALCIHKKKQYNGVLDSRMISVVTLMFYVAY